MTAITHRNDRKRRAIWALRAVVTALIVATSGSVAAQIGEYRNDFSVGINGGYVMSNVGFTPKVTQKYLAGPTIGISMRYVCEKYFNTVCSVMAEVNYTQAGWKEDILTEDKQQVINAVTGLPEEYSRKLGYIQIPIFAHLAWGREQRGLQFFVQAGPQIGVMLSESTETNFNFAERNTADRVSAIVAQDTMAVENKFDYGIAVGAGLEYSAPHVGHFLIEARYYYGLGNLYGDSKRDYFQKSNIGNIVFKLTYLFDIVKTGGNRKN